MKPVAIFRHLSWEGAGYLDEFLAARNIPTQMICVDQGESIPDDPQTFSGLVFMGGSMSVNDSLPWIADSLRLIRSAIAHDIPVLGHCLGGQLIAKALGATIRANPVKEIGWGAVQVCDTTEAKNWFGETQHFISFHWHGETFDLPAEATHLLSNTCCAHQAFVFQQKHLALQCHIEMTEAMIIDWCREGCAELHTARHSPCVQSATTMQQNMPDRLRSLHSVADRVYERWLTGLVHT